VKAQPRGTSGLWQDRLLKVNSKGKLRVRKHKKGKLAETMMETVRSTNSTNQPLALIKLNPKTGRTHQLRVQCANRGMPIIGDRTYGDFSLNRKISAKNNIDRMFLHASELSIELHDSQMPPISWNIESPMPRDFIRLFS
jgi:23S rRNA-/tRNA-specific pseudouridylate synthase